MRCSLFAWSHFRTENRLPPRIKSGAGFFLKMLWLGRPFPRGAGMDRERVHAAFELARQRLVYHSVALDPALSFECLGHDIDPEMGLDARPMPGMPEVLVRFIDHLETFGGESQRQLLRDQIAPCHGLRICEPCGTVNAGPRPRESGKGANRTCQVLKVAPPGAHTERS